MNGAVSTRVRGSSAGWPRQRTPAWTRSRESALAGGGTAAAIFLAYVLVRRSPALAIGLLLVVPVAWLLTRSDAGLLTGLVLILILPAWQTVGTAQASVLRLASLAAASTILLSRQRIRPCLTDLALILLVAVTVLGWLLQLDQPHAGRVLSIEFTPIGFYIGARAFAPSAVPRVLVVTLFAGTAGAVTVIYEYLVGHTVFLDTATYQWNATASTIFRPGGIFGGPPQASTVLCFVIVFGIGALDTELRGRWGLLGIGCIGICVVALALTFTRAAFIGLGVALVLYLWMVRSPLLRPTRLVWACGLGCVIVVVALPTLEKNDVIQRGVFRSGTLAAREGYWSTAMPIVTTNPRDFIFGIGSAALETPTISQTTVIPAALAVRPQAFTVSLHSQYVTEWVENGAIGLACLAFLLLVPFLRAARAGRRGDRAYAALAAGLVATAIVMSADTVLLDGPSFALIMTTTAIAGTAGLSRPDLQQPPVPARG
jgi:O-antigen ligase